MQQVWPQAHRLLNSDTAGSLDVSLGRYKDGSQVRLDAGGEGLGAGEDKDVNHGAKVNVAQVQVLQPLARRPNCLQRY